MSELENIDLSNLKNCSQFWDKMEKNDCGRICSDCQQTIFDFRDYSKLEIAIAHATSKGKLCGIYSTGQLVKPKRPQFKKAKQNPIIVGLLGFLSASPIAASQHTNIEKQVITKNINVGEQIKPIIQKESKKTNIQSDSLVIFGNIKDDVGEGLWGATIYIVGTETGAVSDKDGNYAINISDIIDELEELVVSYSFIGFKTQQIKFEKKDILENGSIVHNLKLSEGEVISFYVVEKQTLGQRIWRRMKNFF